MIPIMGRFIYNNQHRILMDKESVKRRLQEQEDYAKKALSKQLVERTNLGYCKKFLDSPLIKAIIGPRRAGKTTLGLLMLKSRQYYYVNFDDEILSMTKTEDMGYIIDALNELFGKRDCIFLDELQNIKGWELFTNRIQRIGYNIVISGSNSHLLSKELASHLGGRAVPLETMPFSFKEFLAAKGFHLEGITDESAGQAKGMLNEYIAHGGFPEAVLMDLDDDAKKAYFEELFNTIIFRDISQRFSIRHHTALVALANIIMSQFGTKTSTLKLAKSLSISNHTANNYISYLAEAYLVLECKKFSYKPSETESSFKKYYCIDTGLLNAKRHSTGSDLGRLMENVVAIELERRGLALYYYTAENKHEADFVVASGRNVQEVVQVVHDENDMPERELKSGILACTALRCKKLTLVTWNKDWNGKDGKIEVKYVPLWKWLLK